MSKKRWRGVYHPEITPGPDGAGPFIKAYAIAGVMEFTFEFSNRTLDKPEGRLPGVSTTKFMNYDAPFEGTTPHFIALRSFSGRFLTADGKLTDRPLGAFEVDVRIAEPGLLACTVRLSDKNSDDPVEVNVGGLIVFFH